MRTNRAHTARGFTLIETLVYVFGLILLLGTMVMALFYMGTWYRYATAGPRADRIGSDLIDRMVRDIRSGDSINAGASSFGSANGALSIQFKTDTSSGTKYFSLSGGRAQYQENGGTTKYLTPSDMTISRLYLTQITTPVSAAIRVEADVTFSTKDGPKTRTYSGVSILRNSYE